MTSSSLNKSSISYLVGNKSAAQFERSKYENFALNFFVTPYEDFYSHLPPGARDVIAPKALFHPLPLIPIGGFWNFLTRPSTRRDIYGCGTGTQSPLGTSAQKILVPLGIPTNDLWSLAMIKASIFNTIFPILDFSNAFGTSVPCRHGSRSSSIFLWLD